MKHHRFRRRTQIGGQKIRAKTNRKKKMRPKKGKCDDLETEEKEFCETLVEGKKDDFANSSAQKKEQWIKNKGQKKSNTTNAAKKDKCDDLETEEKEFCETLVEGKKDDFAKSSAQKKEQWMDSNNKTAEQVDETSSLSQADTDWWPKNKGQDKSKKKKMRPKKANATIWRQKKRNFAKHWWREKRMISQTVQPKKRNSG